MGRGLILDFGFKKSSLVYLGERGDGRRYPLAVSPPLEVAAGPVTLFMHAFLGVRSIYLLVDPSTLSIRIVCVSISAALSFF